MNKSSTVLFTTEQRSQSVVKGTHPSLRLLLLFFILAFATRTVWLYTHAFVIENEGAEYARIAQNLRNGVGYRGLMDGPELVFSPLYPLLIASLSLLSRNVELAARLVCLLSGSLLVIPMVLLSYRHYGRQTAILVGILAAFYPQLVALSSSTYSECLYVTLLMAGCYTALCSIRLLGTKYYFLTGILFGLAYLTRPEALGYPVLIAIGIFILNWKHHARRKESLRATLIILACLCVLAVPYVFFLRKHTGHWRLEGKSEVNYALGQRLNSGMNGAEAAFGLGPHGEPKGPLLSPNSWIGHTGYPKNPLEVLSHVKTSAASNLRALYYSDVSPLLWVPWLLLTTLGLFSRPWDLARAERELFLLVMFAFAALPILVGPKFSAYRFILPLIPFVLLWSAKGLQEFTNSAVETVAGIKFPASVSIPALTVVPWLGAIGLLLCAALTVGEAQIFREQGIQALPLKKAGVWLRLYPLGRKQIMGTGTVVPYYSGGTWIPMPYGSSSLVLKYIEQTRPDFVVLNDYGWRMPADFQPLLKNAGGSLVYDAGPATTPRVLIYRLISSNDKPRSPAIGNSQP